MHRGSPTTLRARAIIGVIALYGLLLQAFLVAAAPIVSPALAGFICAAHDGSGPALPDAPGKHDHQCCTAANAAPVAPPPSIFAEVGAVALPSTFVAWRFEAAVPATGPPTRSASARGPPLV